MKKVSLSVIGLGMAICATAQNANTNTINTNTATANKTNSVVAVKLNDEKTAVKAEELPDAVKKTLAGDAYKGFAVVEAFLIKSANNASHYEVTLTKGTEKQVLKLDTTGKVI